LAVAQWEAGAWAAAIATYRALVARAPEDGAAHRALGDALRLQGEAEAAVPLLRRALELLAGRAELLAGVRLGLAEALVLAAAGEKQPGELAEAAGLARAVLAEGGGDASVLVRLAFVLHRAGDVAAAERCYAAALVQDPERPDARLFLAMLRLVRGDFAGGLPDYEWRRRVPAAGASAATMQRGALPAPWIAPARLDGVTVRAVVEQGHGDTLQFCRYLNLLAGRGARVELAAPGQAGLVPLLRGMKAVAAVVEAADSAPRPDVVVPLLSLPLAFGTELASIPAEVPYLAVPPERRAAWRARLGAGDGRRRVGVVWSGNPDHAGDRLRSIPLARFRRLLDRPGIAFHVLADRLRDGEREELGALAAVHEGLADYADTAALVEMMDLVVAVDTSVAHLAGALGRPTWILLPSQPDWRWLLGRADSPWYPTARLFRQQEPGDWDSVLSRVGEALDAGFR
jgi:hypothetical protein